MRRPFAFLLLFLLTASLTALAGCGPAGPASPSGAPSSPATHTPSPTPTPTSTPTATALPAAISGDVRSLTFSEPVRQNSGPCGFVDTLDFPLDPPDGATATGGGDFARFRERYDGYHAGEDWRLGSSSFGEPVFAIAHGRVTYAQPLGWGPDKGVVIVEHTFHDRRRVLSFYGHLDPPSVTIRAGQCVQRGDQIGAVGDPRTRPHLHFEIRLHLPDTPGPGYWPVDPRLAGWRPPSATIWMERVGALPGVAWTWLSEVGPLQVLGASGEVVLLHSNGELLALDRADGSRSWSHLLPETASAAALDVGGELVYLLSQGGTIEAFQVDQLSIGRRDQVVQPAWLFELEDGGSYDLIPLPGGGLLATASSQTAAISDRGELLWRDEATGRVVDWAHSGAALVLAGSDGVWVADRAGVARWSAQVRGERVAASVQPYVYADDGIYRLDMESQAVERFFNLPDGFARLGDLTVLPDGGVLVVHRDLGDTRLLSIGSDGSLRWERSIRALESRAAELLVVDGQALLMVEAQVGSFTEVQVFAVELDDGELRQVFSAGSRSGTSGPVARLVAEDIVLIGIEGVGFAAWSPRQAIEAVLGL